MFEAKYSKFLTIFLIVIIVGIIGLGGYLGYSYFHKQSVENDADKFVSSFVENIGEGISETDSEQKISEGENENTNVEGIAENISSVETNNTQTQTKKKDYKGFASIGTIEIPKTGAKYPILEDPPTPKKLETAIVALYPKDAVLNTVGNVVLVGHNYRNGQFFSNNKKLTNGDKIYITDLEGKKVVYTVYSVFQTAQNDTGFYNRDTDGKREITLSTCTDASNDQRIIVLASAE